MRTPPPGRSGARHVVRTTSSLARCSRRFALLLVLATASACGANVSLEDGRGDGEGAEGADGAGGASGTSGGYGAGGASSGDGLGPFPDGGRLPARLLDLPAHHLVGDPARSLFYVTLGSDAPEHPDSLVALDPDGEVVWTVGLGSEPRTMAISDDASTLWVGLWGTHGLQRVDLTTTLPTPGPEHALPLDDEGEPTVAVQIVVLAGSTDSVAVSLGRAAEWTDHAAVTIVDDGVPRPDSVRGLDLGFLTGGPPGWLYGFEFGDDGDVLHVFETTPSGTSHRALAGTIDGGFELAHLDGRLVGSYGSVLDVTTPARPTEVGSYRLFGSTLTVDDGAVLAVESGFGDVELRWLDPVALTEVGSLTVTVESDFPVEIAAVGGSIAFLGHPTLTGPGLHLVTDVR